MKKGAKKSATVVMAGDGAALLGDIRSLSEASRQRVATTVNTELAQLYWQIGSRIRQDVLRDERAEYGKQVVEGLAARLTEEFGPGFTKANILHMLRFAEAFPEREIVYTLCRQLSWSHFRVLVYLDDSLKREFYAQLCRVERWSVRTLQNRVQSMLYERTALSKKSEELILVELAELRQHDAVTPDLPKRNQFSKGDTLAVRIREPPAPVVLEPNAAPTH